MIMKKSKSLHKSKLQKAIFADLFKKINELEQLILNKIDDVKKEEIKERVSIVQTIKAK